MPKSPTRHQDAVARRDAHHRALIDKQPTWAGRIRKLSGYLLATARHAGRLQEVAEFLEALIDLIQHHKQLPDIGQKKATGSDAPPARRAGRTPR